MLKRILVAIMLLYGSLLADFNIPKNAIDPLYMLKVENYKDFACKIELKNGKEIYFSSVKSMMDFYYRPWFYKEYEIKDSKDIKTMLVKDYITKNIVEAQKAKYVFGSKLVGPKGDDLIPLSNEDSLKVFKAKYGGTKILEFKDITKGLIKYLDM